MDAIALGCKWADQAHDRSAGAGHIKPRFWANRKRHRRAGPVGDRWLAGGGVESWRTGGAVGQLAVVVVVVAAAVEAAVVATGRAPGV